MQESSDTWAMEKDPQHNGALTPRSRRGRPQRLPEEASSTLGYDFSPDSRLAWLLATWRLNSGENELHYQQTFAERLRGLDLSVNNTQISRWESGLRRAPWSIVRAYERVLGLPKGQLVSVGLAMDRLRGIPCVPQPVNVDQAVIDAKLERTLAGSASGGDWFMLAASILGFERVFLPASTWQQLTTRLVNELTRSVGVSRSRRSGAAQLFLEHPLAQPHMSTAIGQMVTDPDAQSLGPSVELIGRMDNPLAARMLLRLTDSDRSALRDAARELVPLQLTRGALDDAAVAAVMEQTLAALRARRRHGAPLEAYDVAASLDDSLFQRLLHAAHETTTAQKLTALRTHGLLVAPSPARSAVRRILAVAQEHPRVLQPLEQDRMLAGLLREALFHVHRERRHLAADVLASSPYASAIGSACLQVAPELQEDLSEHLWRLASCTPPATAPPQVLETALAHPQPTIRILALRVLAQSAGHVDPETADHLHGATLRSTTQVTQREHLRALAMRAPAHLDRLTGTAGAIDLQRAVGWWKHLGGAIRDSDTEVPEAPIADPDWIPAEW